MSIGEEYRMLRSKYNTMLHYTHILSFVACVRVLGNISSPID